MFYRFFKNTVFLLFTVLFSCYGNAKIKNHLHDSAQKYNYKTINPEKKEQNKALIVGANRTAKYLPLLKGKKVGIIGNQTSVIFKEKGYTHLVDSLLARRVNVTTVFSPEHGFRGTASAGETVQNGTDKATGLPIISLYGKHKKPTSEDLANIDILVFDIQDVGLRFYTYLSTLHYVMEAAAENNIPLLVFDRPNPNGDYIDGPVLEEQYKSFVGMDPIPVVHGMTMGEYAKMINGEGWLKNEIHCDLTVIKMKNHTKGQAYSLPIKPSPNLPNDKAINLYPSLCFFEGTTVNAGRGTATPFQVFGSPDLDPDYFDFRYTPQPNPGAQHPKHEGALCYGKDLRQTEVLHRINLKWLITAYKHSKKEHEFFKPFFTKLAGTKKLQLQIENGLSAKAIRQSWRKDLQAYNAMRQNYLLY